MKIFLFISLFYFVACGSGLEKTNTVVIGKPEVSSEPLSETNTTPTEEVATIPNGAVTANFIIDQTAFYGFVYNVNKSKGVTTIAFENNSAPTIVLNEVYGATLKMLRFKEFDCDLLLVDTKLKDPQFHKYHLYILKNNQWLPVVKPFAIHESHKEAQLNPIKVDPDNPNKMFRYYSVFDIDDTDDQDYGWRLHDESVAILNR